MNRIVRIYKPNPFSQSFLKAFIACCTYASIGLADDAEAGVAGSVFVEDGAGAIGGAVIDADCLPVGEGLCEDAVEALAQVRRDIVDGDDD